MDNPQGPTVYLRELCVCCVVAWMGEEPGGEGYLHVWLFLCCAPETITVL